MIRTDNLTNLNIFLKVFSDAVFLMLFCHGIYVILGNFLSKRKTAVFLCTAVWGIFCASSIYGAASFELRAFYPVTYILTYIIYKNTLFPTADYLYFRLFMFLSSVTAVILRPVMTIYRFSAGKCAGAAKKMRKRTSSLLQKGKKVYNTYVTYFNFTGRRNERKKEQNTKKS